MNFREDLSVRIQQVKAELDEIEAYQGEQHAHALIGKCFTCQPTDQGAYNDPGDWFLYLMITKANGDYLAGIKFAQDSKGGIEIMSGYALPAGMLGDCKQIARAEFTTAWKKLITELHPLAA